MLLKMPQGLSNCTLYAHIDTHTHTHTHTHRHFSGSSQAPCLVSDGLSVIGTCLGLLIPNGSRQKHLEHLWETQETTRSYRDLHTFKGLSSSVQRKGVKSGICGAMGHLFLSHDV